MELSTRALAVLCAVVELYIRSGEPIASRQVAHHCRLGLSPATMRNVMAELEDGGFLSRPHTSAGSVPSDRGFRLYVDNLPRPSAPPPAMQRHLAERLETMGRQLAEDSEWVAHLMAEATREAGVMVRPIGKGPVLEAVSLVLLENRLVLGVVVADDGTVEKRVIELGREVTREHLQTLSNFLTQQLSGTALCEIDSLPSDDAGDPDEAAADGMKTDAAEVVRQLFTLEESEIEVRIAGTDNLLATDDFAQIERVRSLLSTLEDRGRIAADFRRALHDGRTQVVIGRESETTADGDLGIVATLYFKGQRRAGAVGVVGPRRMDYQRILPVVEYIGKSLTQMLGDSGAKHA